MRHIGNVQVSGSFKQQGSDDNQFLGNLSISGSTIFSNGSTKFGDDVTDTHQFTGSLQILNNLELNSSNNKIAGFVDPVYSLDTLTISSTNGQIYFYVSTSSLDLNSTDELYAAMYNDLGDKVIDFNYADKFITPDGVAVTSTITVKENVVDLSQYYLNNFDLLRPVEFDWKYRNGHGLGFIAEELAELYPEMIEYKREDPTTIAGYQPIELIPVLVQVVKDLRQRVADLESGTGA